MSYQLRACLRSAACRTGSVGPAMASSTWKRSFGYWNIHSVADIEEVLNKTIIKLVDHKPDRAELTMKSEWVQGLKDIGLNVTTLSQPCILHESPSCEGRQTIAEAEVRHVYTHKFWPEAKRERAGVVILAFGVQSAGQASSALPWHLQP